MRLPITTGGAAPRVGKPDFSGGDLGAAGLDEHAELVHLRVTAHIPSLPLEREPVRGRKTSQDDFFHWGEPAPVRKHGCVPTSLRPSRRALTSSHYSGKNNQEEIR